jgi:hypothetical protein
MMATRLEDVSPSGVEPASPAPRGGHVGRWRTFAVLLLASLGGVLAVIPYTFALAPPRLPADGPPLAVLLLLSLVQNAVLLAAAIAVGLWLGPRVGLGAPLMADLLLGVPGAWSRVRRFAPTAAAIGAALAVVIVVLDMAVFGPNMPRDLSADRAASVAPWQRFLASFYGGIDEEVLLRLGLMTLLVWLGTRLLRADRPGLAVLWTANLIAAVLFGLGRLPATAALVALTPLVVIRAVVLNGLVGLACGVLYWRESILAAMIAHFCADLVLHVLAPLAVGGG